MDGEVESQACRPTDTDLTSLSLGEIRSRREACTEVETQYSYLRRLVQGHLDIVRGELERRSQGGDPTDLEDLVARLPGILADRSRTPGIGRLADAVVPTAPEGVLADRLDAATARIPLEGLAAADDDALHSVIEELSGLEREVSAERRTLFDRIDALQAELTRRYRDGEAQVDDLLTSPS